MRTVREAFRAECERLERVLRDLDDAALDRPTPCPPWRVRDLIAHVSTGAGRLAGMLAEPAPPRPEVDAAAYFGAAKFSPPVDRDRIDSARRAAREHPGAAEVADEFARAWRATGEAVAAAPPGRVVRTRHGDAMALPEFLRTRVVEVAVHGLDLADALDRPPWLTPPAAAVAAGVLTGGAPVPPGLRWDALTVLRKATGRLPLTGDEQAELARAGIGRLAFGG
ncbi:maleylpyruvate isomerase N-terminal domain-containing protein [Micromonospora aurantiaca]|uniref:Maleylpyruvate isomerase family mycothiol-dependent enzyme n=1 Tax=Micromonospora aurantiaca (nom. illeg.) TaxID=47850 RepID=A0A6N3K7U9_9ACTN|nr:maleylpyruvate isomerase N-terminal domain-containing protein [Micromonospora aurantiaca]AXH93752.1 maleylpyruvate isomerase family mycothiol-dependent enzyme [Micromonospora aurantiaca]